MNRHHFIFSAMLLLITAATFGQQKNNHKEFTLSVTVNWNMQGPVYLGYFDENGKNIRDSSELKNGSYQFKGQISEPSIAVLTSSKKVLSANDDNDKPLRADEPNATLLFLEPAVMQASVDAWNFKNLKVTGSTTENDYLPLSLKREALMDKWKRSDDSLVKASGKEETVRLREQLLSSFHRQEQTMMYRFIQQHPDSYASAYIFGYCRFTLDSLKLFYGRLSPHIKHSIYGREIKEDIEKRERVLVGKLAPDFRETDADGKTVALKDYRGQYVLLWFWGSWNSASRTENVKLVHVYNRYKEKNFSIIGISLDGQTTHKNWLAALEKDGMRWAQLTRLKGENNPVDNYNVGSIPSSFLIDPKGRIIATNLMAEKLAEKLEKLLK